MRDNNHLIQVSRGQREGKVLIKAEAIGLERGMTDNFKEMINEYTRVIGGITQNSVKEVGDVDDEEEESGAKSPSVHVLTGISLTTYHASF